KVVLSSPVVQVGFSSRTTCNCSELSLFEHSALGSSFRPKSSFLKREGKTHLLQVFLFTTSFP
ncbi:unnamed protein product, partial [Hymenolepis diminuta]